MEDSSHCSLSYKISRTHNQRRAPRPKPDNSTECGIYNSIRDDSKCVGKALAVTNVGVFPGVRV